MKNRNLLILAMTGSLSMTACSNSSFDTLSVSADPTDTKASEDQSIFSVSSQVLADGQSRSTIHLILRNKLGIPLSGKKMKISVSGSLNSMTECPASNSLGSSICYLSSTMAETKMITAQGDFTLTRQTVFLAVTSSKHFGSIVSAGNFQKSLTGQKLMATVGPLYGQIKNFVSNENSLRLKSGIQGQIWKD